MGNKDVVAIKDTVGTRQPGPQPDLRLEDQDKDIVLALWEKYGRDKVKALRGLKLTLAGAIAKLEAK